MLKTGHLSRYGSDDDPRFLHKVYTLEQEFMAKVNSRHCLAMASGTTPLWQV